MNSNGNYTQFIEHSFRRLTLLIHQQDDLDSTTSVSSKKTTEQSAYIPSSVDKKKNNSNNDELVLFSSKNPSRYQHLVDDKTINSIKTTVNVDPILKTHRTYMRPPKSRTILYRCSSSQLSDRSEISLNHSLNSPCSHSVIQQEPSELPIHMPHERTLYDMKFERDLQNDVRQKYNIPPPFQRQWLRQPRYIPQERPNIGQIHPSQNQ